MMEIFSFLKLTKPTLTYKNHFRFGYNHCDFNLRTSQNDVWTVRYGRSERLPAGFAEECRIAARRIAALARGPIVVLFSGGVDSEVVVRSFVEAQIPVTAAIMKFAHGLNEHDISWAFQCCDRLGVKTSVYDLDLETFWESQLLNYAAPTQCISPQLAATMWLVDQIEGFPVLGSGECLLERSSQSDPSWYLFEKEKIAAWYRHFLLRKRSGAPGFFQFTPELMLSFTLDPFVQKKLRSESCSSKEFKLEFYQQHFDVVSRPKYTGFEKVQELDALYRKKLEQLFPFSNAVIKTELNALQTQLQCRNIPS